MPTSQYQITVNSFNGTTPCQSYSVYTGTTYDIDSADYVEDVTVPVSGYTLSLDIDSSYTGVYLFIEHCDGHISSVPSSTPKLQGGYQLVFVDLRCDDCIGERPAPTPTPTLTVTPTYSQTVTPTYSQTVTPTYSQTVTPTINASATPTPTYSQTVTPTLTPTVTQTITVTTTPTSIIAEGCYCYEFYIDESEFGDYGGPIVQYLDCSSTPQSIGFSGIGGFSGFCISQITDWYRYVGPGESDIAPIEFSTYTNTGNPCTVDGDCIVTGEPTPTPTLTPTIASEPTPTPTYSQTITPTRTVTVTPTLTPTVSQTVTPTLTITPTVTQTITITETPLDVTPTITPTFVDSTPCNCYTVECRNPEGCTLLPYENCDGLMMSGFTFAGVMTTNICGNITNLEQTDLTITNTGNSCFFDGEIYTCLSCYCSTITITDEDILDSDDGRVKVDVIECNGTSTILQYSTPGTYYKCLQSIVQIYVTIGGAQTAPKTSTAFLGGISCTSDNDCQPT